MPPTYNRKLGARTYLDYTEETKEKALQDVSRLGLKGAHRSTWHSMWDAIQQTWKTHKKNHRKQLWYATI